MWLQSLLNRQWEHRHYAVFKKKKKKKTITSFASILPEHLLNFFALQSNRRSLPSPATPAPSERTRVLTAHLPCSREVVASLSIILAQLSATARLFPRFRGVCDFILPHNQVVFICRRGLFMGWRLTLRIVLIKKKNVQAEDRTLLHWLTSGTEADAFSIASIC